MTQKICRFRVSIQFYRRLLVLVALIALCQTFNVSNALAQEQLTTRILYINSYHPGYQWSDDIQAALMEGFNDSPHRIELSIEYLDSRRFDSEQRIEQLATTIKPKYKNYPLDLVITSDNAAFEFVLKNRDNLFAGLPIVFCGYNNFRPEVLKGEGNITGVNEETDLTGTIELALNIHPEVKTLAFIISTAELSSRRIAEITEKTVLPQYQERFEVAIIKDASVAEIQHRLAALPKQTIVFTAGQTTDRGEGRALTPVESSRLIAVASPYPVYSFWDFNLGTGIVGGSILTGRDQGRVAAQLVLQVINGTKADDIPVVMKSPTSNIIDYSIMAHFGITENRLPLDSIVLNRPTSVWELYRWQISTALLVLVLQSITIFFLVKSMRARRIALVALEEERANLDRRVTERTQELKYEIDVKNRFFSIIAHDLRSPFNVLLGLSRLLVEQVDSLSQKDLVTYATNINNAGEKVFKLLENLLTWARLQMEGMQFNPTLISLSRIVDECIDALSGAAENKQIQITSDIQADTTLADYDMVATIIRNLVGNAIKFTPENGIIKILSRHDSAGVIVSVEDNGVGMTPVQLRNVFSLDQKTSTPGTTGEMGTGLGLSLCKEMTEKNGGQIWIESTPGAGTSIHFSLPSADA